MSSRTRSQIARLRSLETMLSLRPKPILCVRRLHLVFGEIQPLPQSTSTWPSSFRLRHPPCRDRASTCTVRRGRLTPTGFSETRTRLRRAPPMPPHTGPCRRPSVQRGRPSHTQQSRQLCRDRDVLAAAVGELDGLCRRHEFAYYGEWALILEGWATGGEVGGHGSATVSADCGLSARLPECPLVLSAFISARSSRTT